MTDRKQDHPGVIPTGYTLVMDRPMPMAGFSGGSPTQRTKSDLELRVEALEAQVEQLIAMVHPQ